MLAMSCRDLPTICNSLIWLTPLLLDLCVLNISSRGVEGLCYCCSCCCSAEVITASQCCRACDHFILLFAAVSRCSEFAISKFYQLTVQSVRSFPGHVYPSTCCRNKPYFPFLCIGALLIARCHCFLLLLSALGRSESVAPGQKSA